MKKIVLTGAAGRLGSYLREPLSKMTDCLISSDIIDDIGTLYTGEKYIKANLHDYDAMMALLEGADMVVHFGGHADEKSFQEILDTNIIGSYHIWEAAYQNNVRRVIYASSVHAIGMHSRTDGIGIDAPHRPDTYYGLSKCFVEDLARLYWEKKQIESVCLRIFSCAQVTNARSLGTWLSYDDLIHLVEQSVSTPVTKFSIIYGVSNNNRVPVDNSKASFLGYRPKDNAEKYADEILSKHGMEDLNDPQHLYLGGPFASVELGHSATASMNIIDDRKKT